MSLRGELQARLQTFASSHVPPLLIAYEGVPFNKPASGNYLECFLMRGGTMNPTLDGVRYRETGLFQVNVWGLDGNGTLLTENIAEGIRAAFPVVPDVGTVCIDQTPSIADAFKIDGWRVIPVTIQYRQEL